MANSVVDDAIDTHSLDVPAQRTDSIWDNVRTVITPLASLKLTVALFAMAIFIIFAGTLAQVEKDIWEAIDGYFRTPIAWIEFQIFFPPSFFPSKPQVPGGFYFPGGWMIGLFMVINLLAAHGLRFKVQAEGRRLATGLVLIAVGMLVTWLVIAGGSNPDGLQNAGWIEWSTLWGLFKIGLAALWFVTFYGWVKLSRQPDSERWLVHLVGLVPALLGVLLGWMLYEGDAIRLNDSGMRILWQLIKGTAAGLVLLAGCTLVFRKRAGIVLLHGGILLMMFSELLVGTSAEEGQMNIHEGETVNFVQDVRKVELAFIDRVDQTMDDVTVIPQSKLKPGDKIEHELLPCRVEILRLLRNSVVHPPTPGVENPADAGAGLTRVAVDVRPGSGTDSGGTVDLASAYVRFSSKDSGGAKVGTYLVSQLLDDQELVVGNKTYHVALRFKQTPKPFSVQLLDVRKDDYVGTSTPRNYSSDIRLIDESRNVDRKIHIWMNNPLRYAGETFYQSNYNFDPRTGLEMTGLQVVTNAGWMIPYVACMIVATGLLAQFSIVLLRFLNRRATEQELQRKENSAGKRTRKSKSTETPSNSPPSLPELAATYSPLIAIVLFALWVAPQARIPKADSATMNLYEFGKLPLVEQGRVKPFETLARNTLQVISNSRTFKDDNGKSQPAIRWLLDTIANPDIAEKHRVFRIESMEVLDTLGLERRQGLRYSIAELRPKAEEFNKQVEQAQKIGPKDLSLYQRKIMELDRRIRAFTLVDASFRALPFPPFPTEEDFNKDKESTRARLSRIKELLESAARLDDMLTPMHPPLAVPLTSAETESRQKTWEPYAIAWSEAYRQTIRGEEPNPATLALTNIFDAYGRGDAARFNREVAQYHAALAADPPATDLASTATLDVTKTNFEAFFNHFDPFLHGSMLYLFTFVLASLAWLGWTVPLNRAAFWLIVATFGLHTFGLISRIYISGRPPVTNLYSSAVFIGWGCVVLGMVLESVYRLGIGNVVAGVAGFKTLLIAHILAADGDTFTVLQAVLDTQFWLATHVVCITLGYATTFVAGLLGVLYILAGVCSPSLSLDLGRSMTRMIYGIVCFALFFSFVGTVLGGLWADDSWGRFWGWDPKENGALMIVLWNALVIHARWGGMAKDRGLAALAVGGNIVTGWSWFGVNELGVGLHSYGFTEGVLLTLGLFIASQLAIIAAGSLPKEMWWSYRCRASETNAS